MAPALQNSTCVESFAMEPGSILMPQLEVLMLSKDALTNLQFLR